MGITPVQNRTLQEIRAAGLISLTRTTLTALKWEGLKKAGEFDPATYTWRTTKPQPEPQGLPEGRSTPGPHRLLTVAVEAPMATWVRHPLYRSALSPLMVSST